MKSYTTLRTDYGIDTKNTSSANLAWGDRMMNDFHRRLLAKRDWSFLHRLRTFTTTASTQFKPLPYDVDQVESAYLTNGTTRYPIKLSPSREHWDSLNWSSAQTSDVPEWGYVYNGEFGIWPIPTTTGLVVSLNSKIRVIDLSAADYSTGTITSITNGAATVVGSGTTWTAQMVGRWIRITYIDTANTGDGVWYEIAGVTSATELTLVRNYGGTTIAAGTAAYTIGQMPLLPEAFHDLPEIYGAYRYWAKEKDAGRTKEFKEMYEDGLKTFIEDWSSDTGSMVIQDGSAMDDMGIGNPNLYVNL